MNNGEYIDSKKRFIWLKTILSNILDAWERALTGRQFSLFSSSSFLTTGVTSANLSWFGKQPLSNEVLRILVSIEM